MTVALVKEKLRIQVLGLSFGGVFTFALLFGFLAGPAILRSCLSKSLQLSPGNDARKVYLNPPFPIIFNVYLFNITNPNGVTNGAKPHVAEVGPYVFEEWKEKYDEVDMDATDSLEFNLRNKFIYRPDLTLPLTGEEMLNIPNAIILAGLIKVYREKPDMINFIIHGINLIFDDPQSVFMEAKAWDILWDGLPINCNQTDFPAKVICTVLKHEMADQIEQVTPTDFRLSLLKMENNTKVGKFEVSRGVKDIKTLNTVLKYNEESQYDLYTDEACDKFNGTDGLMFPPFLKKEDTIWAFSYLLCRSLPIRYTQDTRVMDVQTARFAMEIPGNGVNNCFCRDPVSCPYRGTMDLSICSEAPFLASNPHFYDADPEILRHIDGLNPEKEKHETFADFHLFTGVPLGGRRRLMLSVDMEPVANFSIMKSLPRVPLPLFWLEEAFEMNKTYVDSIQKVIFFQNANTISRWTLMAAGLIGFVVCLIKYVKVSDVTVSIDK